MHRGTTANSAASRARTRALQSIVCTLVAALGACNAPTAQDEITDGVPVDETPERWLSGAELDQDLSGDLRPEAVELIRAHEAGETEEPGVAYAWHPPTTIPVWRRGLDGSSASCSGRVDVIPLEKYVKGVLPHEWIRSWHAESLRAGAIAIRTYAAAWIAAGGKYSCADLDDTTASQVYKDELFAVTNNAVDATANTYVMKNGGPVFAEYSAENGNPTATGISDPLCAGHARNGHGRGTCQWGSQRWASQSAKSHTWILQHYYPGASVMTVGGGGGGGSETIVVDSNNANNDPAKAKVAYTGTWNAATATPGYYGSDYRWAATEQASAPATFSFYLPAAATRTIDAWWVAGTNRSSAATFIAYAANGSELGRATKNQQASGGQWNTLGTFAFSAGWNRVVLSRWQSPGSVVIADAIRVR
ncbi:MAG TPA: SpoIID/LytB domain-containing protein [Kofleriaceae bacterium]|nr:SpoIID/LytB domain-containing protein [Kofleriaceae bacterium]